MEQASLATLARTSAAVRIVCLALSAAVVLGLTGCSASLSEGLSLFAGDPQPAETLDQLDQAVMDRDETVFGAYLDIESIAGHAYTASIEQLRQTAEYQEMVSQLGEEQAEEILKGDVLSYEQVLSRVSEVFSLAALPDDAGLFGVYEVTASDVREYEADLTVESTSGGASRTYILGMAMETDPDLGRIWRIKEIKNITELVDFQAS